uniref:Uncharacterized protein n=1 Tax=Cacopsylla melanoneura TaxID=428564 RepID=A0A8D8SEA5_9HEMI
MGKSASDQMAQLHMAALSGKDQQQHPASSMHPSVPYGQLSQAEVMKLYEAQMAAYMPGASSQEISHLYAMQLAEAQMLQAAQAAQINSAQKLYAAQVASIEEQQKQYALQVQAAQQAHHAAAKMQNEKAAMEAQMMREAQIKAHHQHQAKLNQQAQAQLNQQAQAAHNSSVAGLQAPQATYPMSDAAKLQHNAQVQMMNDAAQHQKLQQQQMQAQQQQMQAADLRKLYEDQFMYDLMQQQALALGYPPQGYGSPRGVPHSLMHPLYSTQMLYAQGPPPPGSAPGMLPYESLPPSRPR